MKSEPTQREIFVNAAEIAGGIILGGVAVALSDAGFHVLGFLFGFLSVGCGLVILAHLIEKLGFKYVKTLLGIFIISDLILFMFLSWHTLSAEKSNDLKAYPHFQFSLVSSAAPLEKLELTNDFLFVTDFHSLSFLKSAPVLLLPCQDGQSNTVLRIGVENDSSVIAEDVQIVITISSNWVCLPNFPWEKVEQKSFDVFGSPKGFMTNAVQSWVYRLPFALLSGTGQRLPDIQIEQSEESKNFNFSIMARAKNSPAEMLSFIVMFPLKTTAIIKKPLVLLGKNTSFNQTEITFPPGIEKEVITITTNVAETSTK